jgi:hypothetical protein
MLGASMSDWLHIGDAVAILGFALLLRYFWVMPRWSTQEYVLVLFCAGGLLADVIFTAHWLSST